MIEVNVQVTPRIGSGDPNPIEPTPTPRDYDLGWLIPDWYLIREHNGIEYTHQSRVEWKEVEEGRPLYDRNGDLMNGLPPTLKFLRSPRVQLTDEPTDELWWEVFNDAAPSSMSLFTRRNRYAGLKRDGVCFTDFTGGHAYNPVLTVCNPVYLLGGRENIGGTPHLNFRTLKVGSLNQMKLQLKLWPLLKMNAVISTRDFGGAGVIPFDHLDGRDVPFLPFGNGIGWIPEDRVWTMSRMEPIPSSYYP